jgi:predicted permease
VSGQPVQIVGIAPEGYAGTLLREVDEGDAPEIWLPLAARRAWPDGGSDGVTVLVRHPHSTTAAAERALAPAVSRMTPYPGMHSPRPVVQPLGYPRDASSVELAAAVALVMAAPLVVVAISCANVANLRLAQATSRTREFAVRMSLGASRGHVVRLLVLEAVALTLLATLAGWAATHVVITMAATALMTVVPVPPALDWRVLGFAMLLAGVVVAGAGLLPALAVTRRVMHVGLRETPQSGGRAHGRARRVLVAAQIALSLVLLVIAGLVVRSLQFTIGARSPVMDELLIVQMDPARLGYDAAAATRFSEDVVQRITAHDRVSAVAISNARLFGSAGGTGYRVAGGADDQWGGADSRRVSPEWFAAMGLDVIAGRTFMAADRGQPVVVIDRTLASRLGGREVVGAPLELPGQPPAIVHVIGVVADAPLRPGASRRIGTIFQPFVVDTRSSGVVVFRPGAPAVRSPSAADGPPVPAPFTLFIRARDPEPLIPELRRLIASVEPRAPWTRFETAEMVLAQETSPLRLVASSLSGLGGLALALAATGLYAVMAFVVSLRTRELGVRAALGARRGDLLRLVVGQTLRMTTSGIVAGLAIAIPVAYAIRSLLVQVSFIDPASLVPVVLVIVAVALAAALVPARRAAAADPASVLRSE